MLSQLKSLPYILFAVFVFNTGTCVYLALQPRGLFFQWVAGVAAVCNGLIALWTLYRIVSSWWDKPQCLNDSK
jgi:hypothetical protein